MMMMKMPTTAAAIALRLTLLPLMRTLLLLLLRRVDAIYCCVEWMQSQKQRDCLGMDGGMRA